jgi:hypothetical protein
LVHDHDEMTPLAYQLGETGMQGYVRLTEAALSVLARRQFAPRFSHADLVRYVSSVRVGRIADGDEYDFDPLAGEEVLLYSLAQGARHAPELEPRLRATISLLDALAENQLTRDADVNAVLEEARAIADRWPTQQGKQ